MRLTSALVTISLLAASPAFAAPHDTQLFMPDRASSAAFTDAAFNFGQNSLGRDSFGQSLLGQNFGGNGLRGQVGQLRRELGIVQRVIIFIRIRIVVIIRPVSP